MRIFVYGTLVDSEVRRLLWGDDLPAEQIEPAGLTGWRCVYVRGRSYPTLAPDRRASVTGLLLKGIDAQRLDELRDYEGHDYRLIGVRALKLASARERGAATFVTHPSVAVSARLWRFAEWRLKHRRTFLDGFGRAPAVPASSELPSALLR